MLAMKKCTESWRSRIYGTECAQVEIKKTKTSITAVVDNTCFSCDGSAGICETTQTAS